MKAPSRIHLKSGIDSVRGAKFRSFWTMLGIIIGVTSVITVVAIGEGIKQQIGGQIHHLGQNLITVRPAQLTAGGGAGNNNANVIAGLSVGGTLTPNDIGLIGRTKGLAASAPLTITAGSVTGDHGSYPDGFVIGTSSALPGLLNQSMAYGSFFGDQDSGSNVAVLGQHASEALFNEDVPLGRSFTFHGQTFIVSGIFNQFTTLPLSQEVNFNNAIFIPNDVAESLTKNTAPTYEILARPANGQSVAAAISKVKSVLDRAHGGQSNLSVTSGNQDITASDGILNLLTRLIAGVAAISLVVGGLGIMNVMFVSIAERTHEIGIRKAVGATNRQILSQFMIESSLLSLSGGVIGVVLAFLIDLALRAFTDLQPSISWQIVLLATGVSFMVGLIFGTLPAIKAARKNPIEALRNE
jgi:putative ABC transport system permease protein